MKKNMIRVLALVLVLILALGLIPLGAMAFEVEVYEDYYTKQNPASKDLDYSYSHPSIIADSSVTIKASSFPSLVYENGKYYDLAGVYSSFPTNTNKSIDMKSSVTFTSSGWVGFGYVPHGHKLTCWAIDPTNHWRNCTVCGEEFIGINWHYDNDLDDFCDVCGGEIYYYDIDLKDFEGGKITVEEDTARYRDMIDIKIEAEEGYQFHKLHILKVRPNGTKDEVTRKTITKGESYLLRMPSFPVEIYADFIKK